MLATLLKEKKNTIPFGISEWNLYNDNVSNNKTNNLITRRIMVVYVVKVQREHESYTTSSGIVGVYSNKESARKQMKENFDEEVECWKSEYGYNDDDLTLREGTDLCSVYDGVGGIEFTEFEISEVEVED